MPDIPKPEGYDLRNKRSERSQNAKDWLPEDALYKASIDMKIAQPADAMMIAWFYYNEDGVLTIHHKEWGSDARMALALIELMKDRVLYDMHNPLEST